MMNWSGCSTFLKRFLKGAAFFTCLLAVQAQAQQTGSFHRPAGYSLDLSYQPYSPGIADTTDPSLQYPEPKNVLYKSLMIPGWGQIVNDQWWKVPIVYGLLGGLTGYSIFLTKKYHDYRAAYYNENPQQENTDQRFGSTPAYLEGINPNSLRDSRNFYRNRRDFIYITIALAYGLNAIDAYVFAHLRTFDVSEDLSMRPSIKPGILANRSPGITLSLELFKSTK